MPVPWSGGAAIRTAALEAVKERWTWMEFNAHYFAYSTDPEFHVVSRNCDDRVVLGVKELIRQWTPNRAAAIAALNQWMEFKEAAINAEEARGVHPKVWWRYNGSRWPDLKPLCIKVHSCGTVVSACERNWSDWKYMYNLRHSLGIGTGSKLVYMHSNLKELGRQANALSTNTPSFIPWGYMKS